LSAVRRLAWGLSAHNGLEAAAAIAFWFFLSLVPLLVLLGFLVGQVARARGVDALVAARRSRRSASRATSGRPPRGCTT
jgi:uncharacterized BrkB/YihY/UPF0761 family membrane protein